MGAWWQKVRGHYCDAVVIILENDCWLVADSRQSVHLTTRVVVIVENCCHCWSLVGKQTVWGYLFQVPIDVKLESRHKIYNVTPAANSQSQTSQIMNFCDQIPNLPDTGLKTDFMQKQNLMWAEKHCFHCVKRYLLYTGIKRSVPSGLSSSMNYNLLTTFKYSKLKHHLKWKRNMYSHRPRICLHV